MKRRLGRLLFWALWDVNVVGYDKADHALKVSIRQRWTLKLALAILGRLLA